MFEIASEWDEIEVAMSDKKMWLFLSGVDYKPTSKIEYIFNILAEKWNKTESIFNLHPRNQSIMNI